MIPQIQLNYNTFEYYDRSALTVIGFDEPEHRFRNITFKNLKLYAGKTDVFPSVEIENVEKLTLENIENVHR